MAQAGTDAIFKDEALFAALVGLAAPLKDAFRSSSQPRLSNDMTTYIFDAVLPTITALARMHYRPLEAMATTKPMNDLARLVSGFAEYATPYLAKHGDLKALSLCLMQLQQKCPASVTLRALREVGDRLVLADEGGLKPLRDETYVGGWDVAVLPPPLF